MIKALLFDVDGTLADTERDGHRPAFNAAFREFGLDWNWDVTLYGQLLAVTGGKERMKYYVDNFHPDYVKSADFDAMVAALHKAKTTHYTRMLAQGGIPLRPGVRRLLQEARDKGLILGIATTTTPENVTELLRHSLAPDGPEWFDVIAPRSQRRIFMSGPCNSSDCSRTNVWHSKIQRMAFVRRWGRIFVPWSRSTTTRVNTISVAPWPSSPT